MSNREFFASMLAGETGRFASVLAAVPADKLDWRPEPKARTAGELIAHLIGHDQDLEELATTGSIHHRVHVPFDDHAHALRLFAESRDAAVGAVKACDDASWAAPGRFFVGEQLVYELPRLQLAWILFLDAVHHRGQLSTYLRPMGSTCPSIYGPSADTRPA